MRDSIRCIVTRFWNSLPQHVRTAHNPRGGALNSQIWVSQLNSMLVVTSSLRLGPYNNPKPATDPDGLRAALDALRPWLDATAEVLPPLRLHVVSTRGGPPARWCEGLFTLSRRITTPAGKVTVDLDPATIAGLIEKQFGPGADDPDAPPPSADALRRLRRSTQDRDELEAELDEHWGARDAIPAPDRERIASAEAAMLDASLAEWDAVYQGYLDADPWLDVVARARPAGLTDHAEPPKPSLDGPRPATAADAVPPLDRPVIHRIQDRLKQHQDRFCFTTHERYRNASTRAVVRQAIRHACQPLGLPGREARTVLAVGVAAAKRLGSPRPHTGWLLTEVARRTCVERYLAEADRQSEAIANALARLPASLVERLWTRLYGHVLEHGETQPDAKMVIDAVGSAVGDAKSALGPATTRPPNGPQPGPEPEVTHRVVVVLDCMVDDKAVGGIPCPLLPYLNTLRRRGTPEQEREREQTWNAFAAWHEQLHPDLGYETTYYEVRDFVACHWARRHKEDDDD